MRPLPVVALALAALLPPAAPARASDGLLDQYAATDRFRSGAPRAFAFTPDGREVLFLRSGARDRVNDLWSLDLATGGEQRIATAADLLGGAAETLTPEERARRERLRLSARGIASFELSRDGRRLLVPLSGRLFLLDRAGPAVRELSPGAPAARDARFSPDGARVACVRGDRVCVIDLSTGAERTLVGPDSAGVTWGSPEFVAQEEMDRFAGWWWSPDSRQLLVQRTDESRVERMRIADALHPERAPQEWAYPRPGRENADVRLAFVSAEGGAPRFVEWDRGAFPYVCVVEWSAPGGPLIEVMDRAQQHARVLRADPATGATHVVLEAEDPAWLNLSPGSPGALAKDDAVLWIAERDDTGPWLERRDEGRAPRRLTPPGLRVRQLLGVDEAAGAAFVLANDADPRETHVWRVPLSGRGVPRRLGGDIGVETATFARETGLHVRALRPLAGASRWLVEDGEGRLRGEVRSLAETPPAPRLEFATVGPESLRASIVRPRDFDPRRRYPVIESAYGGPHSQQVQRAAGGYVLDQWLADQGFVVVRMDGRGTPGRGRSWERAIRGDFIDSVLADHVAGLRALCAEDPSLDAGRIGVTGWSFGGYYSVLAVERAPDVYRAAVAGAPVTDWHDYDTFYTERYLGLPQEDSLAYARSSALTDAATLSRPLMLIHGTDDDNVYFFHSLQLADALNRAGRDYVLLPIPGSTHGVVDPARVRQEHERGAGFLRARLGAPGDAAPPLP